MIELGPFILENPIAKGGMGEVWRGYHRLQGIPVAIKVMTSERRRSLHYLASFRREVQTMAGLDHPCIITVLDHGAVPKSADRASQGRLIEGSPFLAMEWATGGTLLHLFDRMLWPHLKVMLLDILDALAHAHARGVIHRDLKPENILLFSREGAFPQLKLSDFGLAHSATSERSSDVAGSTAGTPEYMAPEQLMAQWRDYGPWTDFYALGCLAYQFSSGRLPFQNSNINELMRSHVYDQPPPLDPIMEVPKAFHDWVYRLLAKRPIDRFQHAAEAAWALFNMGNPSPSAHHTQHTASMASLQVLPTHHSITLGQSSAKEGMPIQPTENIDVVTQEFGSQDLRHPQPMPPSEMTSSAGLPVIEGSITPLIPEDWHRAIPKRPLPLIGAGLGLYTLRPVPLVGRVLERDHIWSTLRLMHEEQSAHAIILRGGTGVGKSRLVEWIAERAQEVGAAIVMKAIHSARGGPRSGIPRMIARHLGCVGLSQEEIYKRTRRLLTQQGVPDDTYDLQVLAEMMELSGAWSSSGHTTLQGPLSTTSTQDNVTRRLCERIAKSKSLLIWIDDAQWGRSALRFVEHLLTFQVLYPTPILFLITINDEQMPPFVEEQLAALQKRTEVSCLEIEPFSPSTHRELIQQLLPLEKTLAAQVAERTAGNPLFAIQLVGDWVAQQVLKVGTEGFYLDSTHTDILPNDIHQLWRKRLQMLVRHYPDDQIEDAQRALELAAALGRDVDDAEWRMVCSLMNIVIPVGFLSNLIAARLAKRSQSSWSFTHRMLCESLERRAQEEGRWLHLHLICAQMLRHRYEKLHPHVAARYAQHLLAGGAGHQALEPLLSAANEALNASDFPEASALLKERAKTMQALGFPKEDLHWAENHLCKAGIHATQGALNEAAHSLEQIPPIGDNNSSTAAEVERLRGMIARKRGDNLGGIAHLKEALRRYRKLGIHQGVAHCLNGLGALFQTRGDLSNATNAFEEAIDLFELSQDLEGVGMCLNGLAEICRQKGDMGRAVEFLERAISYLDRAGDRLSVAGCFNDLGDVARSQGDLYEATSCYQKALKSMEIISPDEAIVPRNNLGLVHLARQNYHAAWRVFQRVQAELKAMNRPGYEGIVHVEMLPCCAIFLDWSAWEYHAQTAQKLLQHHPLISDDIAWCAQLAADLAKRAGQYDKAHSAYNLALDHWRALSQNLKIEEVNAALQEIELLRARKPI